MKISGMRSRPIRVGISSAAFVASAALTQAEWETRYAITRNFFTVQYVRSQQEVIVNVRRSLENGRDRLKKILAIGIVDAKVTELDIEAIDNLKSNGLSHVAEIFIALTRIKQKITVLTRLLGLHRYSKISV